MSETASLVRQEVERDDGLTEAVSSVSVAVVEESLLPEEGGSLFEIEVCFELYGAHRDCPLGHSFAALSASTGTLTNRRNRAHMANFQPTTEAHCVSFTAGPCTGPFWG